METLYGNTKPWPAYGDPKKVVPEMLAWAVSDCARVVQSLGGDPLRALLEMKFYFVPPGGDMADPLASEYLAGWKVAIRDVPSTGDPHELREGGRAPRVP